MGAAAGEVTVDGASAPIDDASGGNDTSVSTVTVPTALLPTDGSSRFLEFFLHFKGYVFSVFNLITLFVTDALTEI